MADSFFNLVKLKHALGIFENLGNRRRLLRTPRDPAWSKKVYMNYSDLGPLEYTEVSCHFEGSQPCKFLSFEVFKDPHDDRE